MHRAATQRRIRTARFKKQITFPGTERMRAVSPHSPHLHPLLETSSVRLQTVPSASLVFLPCKLKFKEILLKRWSLDRVKRPQIQAPICPMCLGCRQIPSSPSVRRFYSRMWGEFIGLKSALFRFVPALVPWGPHMGCPHGLEEGHVKCPPSRIVAAQ